MRTLSLVSLDGGNDSLRWMLTKNGSFTVKSWYKWLLKDNDNAVRYPHKQIWKVNVPPRISVFAWEECREHILTINKLRRRGQVLVNACYFCEKAEESFNNLLWCPMVYELWTLVYRLLGINWVMAGSVTYELWAWESLRK